MDDKNSAKLKVVVALLIAAVLFVATVYIFIINGFTTAKKIEIDEDIISRPQNTIYSFNVDITDENLKLDGYIYVVGSDTFSINNFVCLYNKQEDIYYQIPTKMVLNEQANEATGGEYNYARSGFVATLPLTETFSNLSDFEICFYYRNDDFNNLINTGHKVVEGQYSELAYEK